MVGWRLEIRREGLKSGRDSSLFICLLLCECECTCLSSKTQPPSCPPLNILSPSVFLSCCSSVSWLHALRQTLRTQSSQIQPTEIIKGLHAAKNKGVCIFKVGRGQVFGVSGCQDASGWVQLVRKTGYCLTLPLTWLQYQCWGVHWVSATPWLTPPKDVHVYRGVLANICPVQRDRQAPRAWRDVYSYLVLCTSPGAQINTHDAFSGCILIMIMVQTNTELSF